MAAVPASSPKIVCLLSGPRTGSTRVFSLLGGFDRLYARAEIFNPEVAESLEEECAGLGRLAGISGVSAPTDRRLVAWMRANPNTALDWLAEHAGDRTFVFKLFPGHVTDVKEQTRVIQRRDVAHMIVRRRPIDVYISLEKARITTAMRHADTTAVQIRGDVGDFLAMARRIREWYRYCLGLIDRAGRPRVDVSYLGEIAKPDAMALAALREKLGSLSVDPGVFRGVAGAEINRQDRSDAYPDKMSNWAEFAEALRRQGEYLAAFQE